MTFLINDLVAFRTSDLKLRSCPFLQFCIGKQSLSYTESRDRSIGKIKPFEDKHKNPFTTAGERRILMRNSLKSDNEEHAKHHKSWRDLSAVDAGGISNFILLIRSCTHARLNQKLIIRLAEYPELKIPFSYSVQHRDGKIGGKFSYTYLIYSTRGFVFSIAVPLKWKFWQMKEFIYIPIVVFIIILIRLVFHLFPKKKCLWGGEQVQNLPKNCVLCRWLEAFYDHSIPWW